MVFVLGLHQEALRTDIQKVDNLQASVTGGRAEPLNRDMTRYGDGWDVQLVAKGERSQSIQNYLGVRHKAADGRGPEDVMSPPAFPELVGVTFVHQDWGKNNGGFVEDIRSDSPAKKEWLVDVHAKPSGDHVTLTWPNVSEVPNGWSVKITDTKTNITEVYEEFEFVLLRYG